MSSRLLSVLLFFAGVGIAMAWPPTKIAIENLSDTNYTLVFLDTDPGCNWTIPPPDFIAHRGWAIFEVFCGGGATSFYFKVNYQPFLPNMNPLGACASFSASLGVLSPWCWSGLELCRWNPPKGYLERRPMCQLNPVADCTVVSPTTLEYRLNGACKYS